MAKYFSLDDDFNDRHDRRAPPAPSTYALLCTLFSVFAVIFLTIVGFMMSSGSPFIVHELSADRKQQQSYGVFLAAGLYALLAFSCGFHYRSQAHAAERAAASDL